MIRKLNKMGHMLVEGNCKIGISLAKLPSPLVHEVNDCMLEICFGLPNYRQKS